jgi:hypothetical protein
MKNEKLKSENPKTIAIWKRKFLIWKNLKIIKRKPVVIHSKVDIAYNEANELMAIL